MKNLIVSSIAMAMAFSIGASALCATTPSATTPSATTANDEVIVAAKIQPAKKAGGNYSDEMKIPYVENIDKENGADSTERKGDHNATPYFSNLDFYNMTSTDTLTIIPKFKTQQQTSEWSCGISSMLMVMEHYGKLGNYNEKSLAEMRSNALKEEATNLNDIVAIFDKIGGFKVESTLDYPGDKIYEHMSLEAIQAYLKDGKPVIVGWNDWGGHWQVIIGYDTMGTEITNDDVIIVADSYDTTDHNQDGYGVYPAERFFYNWTFYDFFTRNYGIEERDMSFCVVTPEEMPAETNN